MTTRRLAAILAGDFVGYSRLMGIDEVATLQALKAIGARWLIRRLSRTRARTAGDQIQCETPQRSAEQRPRLYSEAFESRSEEILGFQAEKEAPFFRGRPNCRPMRGPTHVGSVAPRAPKNSQRRWNTPTSHDAAVPEPAWANKARLGSEGLIGCLAVTVL